MNLYCAKYLTFKKNVIIKIKREIDGKINLSYRFIDWGFKRIETIDEEEVSYLL